jgi:hypothetical protein
MHHRVTAWIWGSCAAPAALLLSALVAMVATGGPGPRFVAFVWLGVIAFLILSLSLALFSPVLLLPLERRVLSPRAKTGLAALALLAGASFMASLLAGPVALSVLLGIVLDAAVFLWILPRPGNTVQSARAA